MKEDLLSYRFVYKKTEYTNALAKSTGELTLDMVELFAKNMVETFREVAEK